MGCLVPLHLSAVRGTVARHPAAVPTHSASVPAAAAAAAVSCSTVVQRWAGHCLLSGCAGGVTGEVPVPPSVSVPALGRRQPRCRGLGFVLYRSW